jgi:hypothetical protein
MRKRLLWLGGTVLFTLLLAAGSTVGGWGAYGPKTEFGYCCLLGVPVSLIFVFVAFFLLIIAMVRARRTDLVNASTRGSQLDRSKEGGDGASMVARSSNATGIQFSAFELKPGARYRVMKSFIDFDRLEHPVGETWRYESRNYFPYDAGMCLNVSKAGTMTCIRFQDYREAQGEIIDRFSNYVSEI